MANPEPDPQGDYELAPPNPPPIARRANSAKPATSGNTLNYQVPKPQASGRAEPEAIRNFYMPLWLLAGGAAVKVIALSFSHSMLSALIAIGVDIVVGTSVMLTGVMIAAKLRQIDLGKFWLAVLKLAAVSIAPSAAVALATPALNVIPGGFIIGFIVEFVAYFVLLGAFFDLDESDTWFCVSIIFLVHVCVYFLLRGIGAA
jgi:hypothetical protein